MPSEIGFIEAEQDPAGSKSAADAIRRQLADLEVKLAQASTRLSKKADTRKELTTEEIEAMRAEVRNQRAALSALVDQRSEAKAKTPSPFAVAGDLVLKGKTAWNVAFQQSA